MMPFRCLVIVQLAMLSGAVRFSTAQTTSAPAVVPADTTSPRGALKALLVATEAGDADAIRAVLHSESPTEQKMVDAIAARALAEKQFRKAAEDKFGQQGLRLLVPDTQAAVADSLSKLDVAKESINGDTATVVGLDDTSELSLKRVGGSWKIPVSQFSHNAQQGDVEQRLDDEKLAVSLINESTADVLAGKYKTAEEAAEGIRTKLWVTAARRASSQPAGASTQPSDPPGSATQPR